ncbi:MAG TPA: hypothetical protein PLD88_13035, partial [Candidatus Berkiella sp.]|nr:hypothetical protein [Candidatus Berkiella sp.]
LTGILEHLNDPHAEISSQFRADAMKLSVDALKQLPKEMKPKSFADIIHMASTNIDSKNINEVTRKVATETIVAVIIPLHATLDQLKQIQKELAARVSSLKLTDPMTQQIAAKIAIRETVKTAILKKSADHQVRPSALRASVGVHPMPTLETSRLKPPQDPEPSPSDPIKTNHRMNSKK